MSTSPANNPQSQPPDNWLEAVSRNRRQAGYVLYALAAAMAAVAIWVITRNGWGFWSVSLWAVLLAVALAGAGSWFALRQPAGQLSDVDATRLAVLTLGGVAGLATVLLVGLALPYSEWWSTFTGGLEQWRKEWWHVALPLVALFGGLVLMFASLQLARGEERSNPFLRRLLYGYNSVLTGLLLLAILLVLNVLSYARAGPFGFFSTPSDWTASNIYSLSPASRNVLASLDKPVKVYVLLSGSDPLMREVQNLMNNCRAVTDRLDVDYVSPDLEPRRVAELIKKYQILETEGILLVYGPEGQEEHEFVNRSDLVEDVRGTRFLFNGENVFIAKLTYLIEGKSRAVVYFTQGGGELDLKNHATDREDAGLGVLQDRLRKGNYEIKELKLGPALERVPDDAAVVVIARPTLPIPEAALKALGTYVNPPAGGKKGKLVILFDVVTTPDGKMVHTGLEKFVENYNVQVGDDRILVVPNNATRYPLQVWVLPDPQSRNPIAAAFRGLTFAFTDVRTVKPKAAPAGGGMDANRYTAETILWVPAQQMGGWAETDLKASPKALVDDLWKNRRQEWRKKVSEEPLSVAVAVTQPKEGGMPRDPHAFMRQDRQPCMAVFGDATWVSNQQMVEGLGNGHYELFASTLAWLRERPDIGKTADPKERKVFVLNEPPDERTRMWSLPLGLMLVGILGLGGGIWLVRRR